MWVLSRRAGTPRCIEYRELANDEALLQGMKVEDSPRPAEDYLREGLELTVARGTVIQVFLRRGDDRQVWFFLNTHASRAAVEKLQGGEVASLNEALGGHRIDEVLVYRPNIFALYEQNIGPLTPLIADVLRNAEKQYPASWIEEAIELSVTYNRRSWRYVETILQRWEADGKDTGPELAAGEPSDPDSYFRTKYAHIYK
jgi:DNA replication protein